MYTGTPFLIALINKKAPLGTLLERSSTALLCTAVGAPMWCYLLPQGTPLLTAKNWKYHRREVTENKSMEGLLTSNNLYAIIPHYFIQGHNTNNTDHAFSRDP